MNIEKKNMENN